MSKFLGPADPSSTDKVLLFNSKLGNNTRIGIAKVLLFSSTLSNRAPFHWI